MFPPRRVISLLLLVAAMVSASVLSAAEPPARLPRTKKLPVGVSLAGAEFGCESSEFSNENPGRLGVDYTFPESDTIQYFSKAGVNVLRIPFRWERIQPRLGQRLDRQHVQELRKLASLARRHRTSLVFDLHNYGRYRLAGFEDCVIDQKVNGSVPVTREHFADLWSRIALEFRHDRSIVGYALMNEPHDMGGSDWKKISQSAVDAIRKTDRKTNIFVCGNDWGSAERFEKANGREAWIRDPANRTIYEAHCYFDQDGSGKYTQSFDAEKAYDLNIADRGVSRVMPFLDWCRRNNVRGFVGEYGTTRENGWKQVTLQFLQECKASNVGVCYWAAGEWWGKYPLSVQPGSSRVVPPQLSWLLQVRAMEETANKK